MWYITKANFETTYFSNHRNANRAGAESKTKREKLILISTPEAKSVLAIYQIDFNFGSTAKREESVPGFKATKILIPW